ncbi:MAG TPA: GntR family transcriptional regulator [Tepidisphaeraceae bacterium]|jgi:GntR family transcriptional regulator
MTQAVRQKLGVDRKSSKPLHLQIEQQLRQLLHRAEYRHGKLLPSEVELAKEFRVSRNTLRAAMTRLGAEGLLTRTPKVGTRVSSKAPHTSLEAWESFTEEMRRQGITVENFRLQLIREPAKPEVAGALGIKQGTLVWKLRRIRGWDNTPAVLAVSWLHPSVNISGNEEFSRPLYRVIGGICGAAPVISREEITALRADKKLARDLHVRAGEAILLRKRVIFAADNRVIEFNMNYYRTDRYTLTLTLGRPKS